MHPTPAAVAAIDAFAAGMSGGWAGNGDAAVLAALNAATLANPAPQPQVARAFQAIDVGMLVSSGTLAGMLAIPAFEMTIRPMLDDPNPKTAYDIGRLNQWAAELFKAGRLTQSEFDAMAAPAPGTTPGAATGLFNQTTGDPAWPAQVSWAAMNLGRPADADDVATARAASP